MDIILAGRAAANIGGTVVPVDEIAIEGSRQWLRSNMHALDVDRHVRIHSRIRHGSAELISLFGAGNKGGSIPLANDTSFGVGYAPLSRLERLVLALEAERSKRPEWGEDTKIMAVHSPGHSRVTVACAIVDAYVMSADDYQSATARLRTDLLAIAARHGFAGLNLQVNAADNIIENRLFLTVTGTSGESGDDGQVGRGNRANGLITPYRSMSLEALAGKNPVSHVGKLYNVIASRIAATLVADIDDVAQARCALVSQIGRPITDPQVVGVTLELLSDRPVESCEERVKAITHEHLNQLRGISDRFIAGEFQLF